MTTHHEANWAPLWDTDDLAAFLKLPPKTLREWRHKGIGPAFKRMGKHVRYQPADVIDWIDNGTDLAA
ncbi:helix-turn-helix domain-containing protein [Actinokineospora sp. HUAS TT18]|uniref:helix-turn-helix domain-containing protein n=1 Tax=Actinokineospora sp. HUAS TT18 TaxID=3447451 RepID=UPI003F5233DB